MVEINSLGGVRKKVAYFGDFNCNQSRKLPILLSSAIFLRQKRPLCVILNCQETFSCLFKSFLIRNHGKNLVPPFCATTATKCGMHICVAYTLCSRNFQNVKLRSTKNNLFATQFCVKSILAKYEFQKLPFLQFQRL